MVAAIIALLLLAFAGSACAELDLTPAPGVYKREVGAVPAVVFHDGAKLITYVPPLGWTCSGGKLAVTISIPKHEQAHAAIGSAPHLRIPTLDGNGAKLFQENPALLQLPRGAEGIKITQVQVNPVVIDSHPTLEVQMTYSFYGQLCAKSLLLADRNGMEVSFSLDCLASDFQDLHAQFFRSLFGIENL